MLLTILLMTREKPPLVERNLNDLPLKNFFLAWVISSVTSSILATLLLSRATCFRAPPGSRARLPRGTKSRTMAASSESVSKTTSSSSSSVLPTSGYSD